MKEINFEKIGQTLKELRTSKGLTQEYVANIADVNTSHISNIENNRVKVSLSTLILICNALQTTVDYVLADEYLSPSDVLDTEILRELQNCSASEKEKFLKIIRILQ